MERIVDSPCVGVDMFEKKEESKFLDTLKVSDAELESVIREVLCSSKGERRWVRRPTNLMRMTAVVHQPGGSIGRYTVRSYDLSEGGVGFFTGHYLHPSSRCQLGITAVDGEIIGVDGVIAHCSNIRGHIHLAGVKFDNPIELAWFDELSGECPKDPNHETFAIIEELKEYIAGSASADVIQDCYDRLGAAMNLGSDSEHLEDENTDDSAMGIVDQPIAPPNA